MKQLRHSKFRNTALIFELLITKIASDTMNNQVSEGLNLLKKYFRKGTQLNFELNLYRALSKKTLKSKENAFKLIEAIIVQRRTLNNKLLNEQKYKLNRDIKKAFGEDFYKVRVSPYRTFATIHNLFEYEEKENPLGYAINRENLLESILTPASGTRKVVEDMTQKDKDISLLSYKILIDKFNSKFNTLGNSQKEILREYINSISNSPKLKKFVDRTAKNIRVRLSKAIGIVEDKVIRIKLTEINKLTTRIIESPIVKEDNILALLQYEELLKELKKV